MLILLEILNHKMFFWKQME